jgi:polar amino acid transport system substrate-binding protein
MITKRTAIRSLSATAALGLVAVALTGCATTAAGSSVAEDCTPAHEGLTTYTDGVLTVGVPENLPYTKTEGTDASGLEIDLVKKVAEAECLGVAFVPITYGNGIPTISEQKKADLITGGWYVTAERAEQVGFTTATFYDAMGIVSADGASTIDELETIGDVGSGAGFSWEADVSAILGDAFKTYPGTIEMKQDLVNGRIQAALDGYAVAVAAYADTDFTVEAVEPDDRVAITTEQPRIAFPIAKENTDLNVAISELIDDYREDGTLAEILATYDLPADLLVPVEESSTEF